MMRAAMPASARKCLAPSVLVLGLVAACSSSPGGGGDPLTALRLHVTLDPAAKITQLQLEGGGHTTTVPEPEAAILGADETVTILLDDGSAGKPLHVDVWGLAGRAKVAHAVIDTVPELHRTLDVSANLSAGGPSCHDDCQRNATQCTEQGLATCGQFDADPCLDWGPPAKCPSGQSCSSGACTACAWTLASIDTTTDVGPSSSIQVDRARGIHVSYWDRTGHALKYAYRASATTGIWSTTTIDDRSAGRQSSLALDTAGGVHVAYTGDEGTRVLRIADRPSGGSAWSRSDVDTIETNGPSPSLVIAPSGTAWVSYLRGNLNTSDRLILRYGQRPSGTAQWTLQTLDETANVGSATSILSDASGNVSIGYYQVPDHDLKYVELSNLTKVTVDAPNNVGQYASFALDASGGVHASYYDYSNLALRYAYRPKIGDWKTMNVDAVPDVGQFTSLAVDPAGDVHIAYYDVTHHALKYARRKGESWFTTTLDPSVHPDGGIALATDAAGVHVSYVGEKQPNNELKYAYLCK